MKLLQVTTFGALLLASGAVANADPMGAEELVLDSTLSLGATTQPAWRDPRPDGMPLGGAYGVQLRTNVPFTISRAEFIVQFDSTNALAETTLEFCVFRGTNGFGMYLEPEFIAQYTFDDPGIQLDPIAGDLWRLSFLTPPQYAFGSSNRVLSIRSMPWSEGDFAHLNLVSSTNAPAWVKGWTAGPTNELEVLSAPIPAMKLWRTPSTPQTSFAYERVGTDLQFTIPPGNLLGISTNLNAPWEWRLPLWDSDIFVDTTEGSGFFTARPDDGE